MDWKVENAKKVSIMVTKSNNKLKQLNLNPLSIAKFLYEKLGERAIEQAFIQPLIYLVYSEILKKENILLFKEEFRAWESSPILESIFWHLPDEEKTLRKLLREVEDLDNSLVIKHLERISKKYRKSEACDLQFEAKNEAWQKAYKNGFIKSTEIGARI